MYIGAPWAELQPSQEGVRRVCVDLTVSFQSDERLALWWRDMAQKSHRQIKDPSLTSQVSSSGGGLPGCPGLERVQGIRYLGSIYALSRQHSAEGRARS